MQFASITMVLVAVVFAPQTTRGETSTPAVAFDRQALTTDYYCDGVNVGDFNRDGQTDIVAGPFWYEGPAFAEAHAFYPPQKLDPAASPSNSMFSFVHDFNGDGWDDVLVLGRVHKHSPYWYENPRNKSGHWQRHYVFERVRGESPALVDLDGDGTPQLVCHWDGRWGWLEPRRREPEKPWRFQPIGERRDWEQFYHGTGVGDINGDGRLDLLINDGWYEQPKRPGLWPFHENKFSEMRGGAQMFAYDVDGDGDSDVITAIDAHGWGLAWFEQVQEGDEIAFREHRIMGDRGEVATFGVAFTQPHALELADIDGDGLKDIVVGKRRWAHGPTGDIEPSAAPVVYWFNLTRSKDGVRYVPHQIDDNSGVGVQICTADVNGDDRTDVLTASKLGVFLFINRGDEPPFE